MMSRNGDGLYVTRNLKDKFLSWQITVLVMGAALGGLSIFVIGTRTDKSAELDIAPVVTEQCATCTLRHQAFQNLKQNRTQVVGSQTKIPDE